MSATNIASRNRYLDESDTDFFAVGEQKKSWHVIWVNSNCEKQVRDQLYAKGYEVFLPEIQQWGNKGKKISSSPMFKGYLFVQHCIDKSAYLDISNTKGVVKLLGWRWNKLAIIPDDEIDSIAQIMRSELPLLPHPYLKCGDRVRITQGALVNTQGVLLESDSEQGLLVVSVSLLQSSVAVKVDIANVEPV